MRPDVGLHFLYYYCTLFRPNLLKGRIRPIKGGRVEVVRR